jgi:hypothetical protein
MGVIGAILGGIVGAVIGAVAAAYLSYVIMGWQGVSDFEGQRGMTSAFVFAPLGGLVGLGLGIWLGVRLGSGAVGFGAFAKYGAVAVLSIAVLVGVVLVVVWQSGDRRLTYDGTGATLEFQIRAPAAFALPARREAIAIDLSTDKNQQPATLDEQWLARDGDWNILSGGVELYFRTGQRLLVLKVGDGRDRLFRLRLSAKPPPGAEWSQWQRADFVGLPGRPRTVPPGPEDPFEIRYRVRAWGP